MRARGTQEFEQILPWRSVEQIAEPGKERSPIGASAVRPSSLRVLSPFAKIPAIIADVPA